MPLIILAIILLICLLAYSIAAYIRDFGSSGSSARHFRKDDIGNLEEMLKARAKEKLYQKVEEKFGKFAGAYEATYEVMDDEDEADENK